MRLLTCIGYYKTHTLLQMRHWSLTDPFFALMASTREVLTFLDLEEDIHV